MKWRGLHLPFFCGRLKIVSQKDGNVNMNKKTIGSIL